MSVEDAVRFLEESDEATQIDEMSVDELIERAGATGYEVSVEDLGTAAERLIEKLKDSGQLDDQDLDAISGGGMATRFQSFDQKANQLYNLLSTVMKAMNEMRMGTTRNML
jgi:hypothetical protein